MNFKRGIVRPLLDAAAWFASETLRKFLLAKAN
jgi:hypothetical protein